MNFAVVYCWKYSNYYLKVITPRIFGSHDSAITYASKVESLVYRLSEQKYIDLMVEPIFVTGKYPTYKEWIADSPYLQMIHPRGEMTIIGRRIHLFNINGEKLSLKDFCEQFTEDTYFEPVQFYSLDAENKIKL